jgi:hypothetical protein
VQLDIFGELMDAVYLVNKYGEAISHEGWKHTVEVVDQVCETGSRAMSASGKCAASSIISCIRA